MECPPCHRPMKLVEYMDTREALPLVCMTGWRCEHCGFAVNPLGELNRRFLEFDVRQRRGETRQRRSAQHLIEQV